MEFKELLMTRYATKKFDGIKLMRVKLISYLR